MLLVPKSKSFDKSFKGDFNLNSKNEILRQKNNKFIFTGAQIINRSVFKKRKIKPFSMNKVWDDLIKNKELIGVISRQKFFHINNYKIYKKTKQKNYWLDIISVFLDPSKYFALKTLPELSKSIIKGFPVGISSKLILLSDILKIFFPKALIVFP